MSMAVSLLQVIPVKMTVIRNCMKLYYNREKQILLLWLRIELNLSGEY